MRDEQVTFRILPGSARGRGNYKLCTICATAIYPDGRIVTFRQHVEDCGIKYHRPLIYRLLDRIIPCPHQWEDGWS